MAYSLSLSLPLSNFLEGNVLVVNLFFFLVVNLINAKPVLIDAVVQAGDNISLLKIEAAHSCSECVTYQV